MKKEFDILDASLNLRTLTNEQKESVVRLIELAVEEAKVRNAVLIRALKIIANVENSKVKLNSRACESIAKRALDYYKTEEETNHDSNSG